MKKLYEGAPPDVVRHWNQHVVQRPPGGPAKYWDKPNVATRSKRVVYSLLGLGEVIAEIAEQVPENLFLSIDFVSLDRQELYRRGWWNDTSIAPITHHVPLQLSQKDFLIRCKHLRELILEGLNESNLRQLLSRLGVCEQEINQLKSGKLLNILIQHAMIAKETGLKMTLDFVEIERRRLETLKEANSKIKLSNPIDFLFLLDELRQVDAHPKKSTDKLLKKLGTDRPSLEAGWGALLDVVYDRLAEALDQSAMLLRDSIR